jgi:Putative prokaryotic signal transducing protein
MPESATPLPNPDEKLVRVFDTEQEAEALVVRSLLTAANIDSQFGESENAPDVLPVGGLGLMVRESDADQARQVIEEYRRSPEQEAAEETAFDSLSQESADAIEDTKLEK